MTRATTPLVRSIDHISLYSEPGRQRFVGILEVIRVVIREVSIFTIIDLIQGFSHHCEQDVSLSRVPARFISGQHDDYSIHVW